MDEIFEGGEFDGLCDAVGDGELCQGAFVVEEDFIFFDSLSKDNGISGKWTVKSDFIEFLSHNPSIFGVASCALLFLSDFLHEPIDVRMIVEITKCGFYCFP